MDTLGGDRFEYHETGRQIIGQRSRKTYSIGDQVRVRLDRADVVERKLQFALVGAEGGARRRKRKKA
jgi:ribonuclease R